MAEKETEILLGTGKLLGLFFALVALCALFLGLGYSWGRKSAQSSPLQLTSAEGDTGASGVKPLASSTPPAATPENCPNGNCDGSQAAPASGTAEPAAQAVPEPQPPVEMTAPSSAQLSTAAAAARVPGAPPTKPITPGSGYLVQVAAVSKQEDAEALAAALRQKQYPVFVSPGTLTDKYFHVQVGPFSDEKQADAMKAKLLGDGYNAIVKK